VDPDTTFFELIELLAEDDIESARARAEYLLDWMASGGFSPLGSKLSQPTVVGFLQWVLAHT